MIYLLDIFVKIAFKVIFRTTHKPSVPNSNNFWNFIYKGSV